MTDKVISGATEGAPATPTPASTLVLLREPPGQGFEVLLLRRTSRNSFMPLAFVFPGGAIDADDDVNATEQRPAGSVGANARIAAIRETFEESNLLVACDGVMPAPERRREIRDRLLSRELSMVEVAEQLGLALRPDRLVYFDRWVTPSFESKRFDAHFFVCPVSMNSTASGEYREIDRAEWMRPEDALQQHAAGELTLYPPTWVTLSWLSSFEDVASVVAAAERREVVPIEPHFTKKSDRVCSLMPGHAEHPVPVAGAPSFALYLCDSCWSFSPEFKDYTYPGSGEGAER